MKRKNNVLFCCAFLSSLLLITSSNNFNNVAIASSVNGESEMQLVNKSYNSQAIPAATLTYDFSEIKNGSGYVAFDASTWNKIDDNSTDYISSVDSNKVYYGDSSQTTETGIKFGNSTTPGTLTLVFKANVTSVKIYATGYKTYSSAIKINGVQTVLTAKQDEEPQLVEFAYTDKSNVLTIETSTDTDSNGYKMLRAWIKKMIVVEEGGIVEDAPITSMTCAGHYKLGIGSVLRLQAFNNRKVVTGVDWSIISGNEYASLKNGRLKGLEYGTVVVKGTYGDIDPVYMTVYIGQKVAAIDFKSLKEIRNYFTASSSIKLDSSYVTNTVFGTYGKIVGFESPTSKNFYINDGNSTMYVYNTTSYTQSQLEIGRDYYLTGCLAAYSNLPEFKLNTLSYTTNKITTGNYFKNTISSYAEWCTLTATYSSKLESMFNFYNVEARFDSVNTDNSINIYFSDDSTKLIKVLNADSMLGYNYLDSYGTGCDITFNSVFKVSSSNSNLSYISGAKIISSAHDFTGSITAVVLSKATADVAIGKTLDVGALVTISGTGDYNKLVKYTLDASTYGSISSKGVLTIGNDPSFIGNSIVVTATSVGDSSKSESITITITENLKSSSITVSNLGLSAYSNDEVGKSISISDDTNTITVAYFQCASYGNGIQMKYADSNQSSVYNLGDVTYNISSITLNQNPAKTIRPSSFFEVYGSTVAFSQAGSTVSETTPIFSSSSEGATLEYSFGTSDYKYFKIQRSKESTYVTYLSSIEVSYKKVV